MKALLIFPPFSDPRGPHPAPACLISASLAKESHEIELWDLDIEMSLRVNILFSLLTIIPNWKF